MGEGIDDLGDLGENFGDSHHSMKTCHSPRSAVLWILLFRLNLSGRWWNLCAGFLGNQLRNESGCGSNCVTIYLTLPDCIFLLGP